MTVNTPEWQQLVGDGVVYEESRGVAETKALVAELCRHFYALGWLSGTGGSVSLKAHDQSIPVGDQLLVMSPSGVQKERMVGEDMYVVAPDGFVLSRPLRKPYPHKPPKCTDSAPLFIKVHKLCSAGAIIHSHGLDACLVTMINPSLKEFRISHMEMIKGVQGHCYGDELVVPIIENTARERELVESLTEAVLAYPRTTAVLVRNHGVYIWGDSWISAKTQAECYHYLFDAAIKLHQLGLDWPTPEHGPVGSVSVYGSGGGFGRDMSQEMKHSIVLDLEGTLTPTPPVYCSNVNEGKYLVRNGLRRDELDGDVFDDVPEALSKWDGSGIKVYIYSNVRRDHQLLLFANSKYGDLRKYLCGFFDTKSGVDTEPSSYFEISQAIGVDRPGNVLFATNSLEKATPASKAGIKVAICVRSEKEPLHENHGFRTIKSLLEL